MTREASARLRKTLDLVHELDRLVRALGRSPDHDAAAIALVIRKCWTDELWQQLAERAGVKPPSDPRERHLGVGTKTRREVLYAYESRAWGRGPVDVSSELREGVLTIFVERPAPEPAPRKTRYVCAICGSEGCRQEAHAEECGIRKIDQWRAA